MRLSKLAPLAAAEEAAATSTRKSKPLEQNIGAQRGEDWVRRRERWHEGYALAARRPSEEASSFTDNHPQAST